MQTKSFWSTAEAADPTRDPAGALSQGVVDLIANPRLHDLPDFLGELAAVVVISLPILQEAQVAAFDHENALLAVGARGAAAEASPAFVDLRHQAEALALQAQGASWLAIDAETYGFSPASRIWALPLRRGNTADAHQGLLILRAPAEASLEATFATLSPNASLLAAAIQAGKRAAALSRIEQLRDLARRTFNGEVEDLHEIVQTVVIDLARLFKAGAVSLFLWEHDKLRLAASTDRALGRERPAIYPTGQGLTGYVHAQGKSLRLKDCGNRREVLSATGMDRAEPTHPERDHDGVLAGPFMGVPLTFSGKVIGVLRLSRRGGSPRFSPEDEPALSFFAELLGAVLAPAWDLQLKRSILESLTEAIAVSRREQAEDGIPISRIVMANKGTAKLLGRPGDMLVGQEASSIYAPGVYAEVKERLATAVERRETEVGPIPSRMLRGDGTTVPVFISYRFLANRLVQPPSLYTIGLARDQSAVEQQAERHQRLLDLLDVTRIAYFRADAAGHTVESTAQETKITGYSQQELRSRSRDVLFTSPEDRDHLLHEMVANHDWLTGRVMKLRRKDKSSFWAACDVRILRDADGNQIGTEGLYRDVTDRLELQRFLNEDEGRLLPDQELLAALRRESEFHLDYVSSVGHQIQAPLAALVETLRNFEQGIISAEKLADRLPYVIGQARVCARLVRNFSYMKNILAGAEFEHAPVSLARLAVETRGDFSHLLKERHLHLEIDEASLKRHLVVSGHRELLRQVFVNLIDNAIKYSLPRSEITIRAREWPEGPALEVGNIGLSIPEQDRARLFERGFRSRLAKVVVPHGTGLGLWLVRNIVEAHGAKIAFAEVLDDGHRRNLFRITFSHSQHVKGGQRARWSKRPARR